MTDADTLANAELLWNLVHLVQDTIRKDGRPMAGRTWNDIYPLAKIRKLADEIDPEYGKY